MFIVLMLVLVCIYTCMLYKEEKTRWNKGKSVHNSPWILVSTNLFGTRNYQDSYGNKCQIKWFKVDV